MTASLARQTYSSPMMQERRRRILAETRALLGESGERGFAMRALSERAGVSSRTLYSAFGDKEGLLSAAIIEYIDGFEAELSAQSRSGQLSDIFAEFDWVMVEVGHNPAYARTLIELFYSMNPLKPALAAIRRLPAGRMERWLAEVPQAALIPGLDLEWAIAHHVDAEIAVFHHWATGRIEAAKTATALKRNFVGSLLTITAGTWREVLREAFMRLSSEARDAPAASL